jgi:hypothetical protein
MTPSLDTEGELVKVASAQNQSEAELLQGLLLDQGVPSVVRRTPGFDVPDFLAAGPRDVMVAASREQEARDALLQTGAGQPPESSGRVMDSPLRVLAGLLVAIAVIALVVWLGTELIG